MHPGIFARRIRSTLGGARTDTTAGIMISEPIYRTSDAINRMSRRHQERVRCAWRGCNSSGAREVRQRREKQSRIPAAHEKAPRRTRRGRRLSPNGTTKPPTCGAHPGRRGSCGLGPTALSGVAQAYPGPSRRTPPLACPLVPLALLLLGYGPLLASPSSQPRYPARLSNPDSLARTHTVRAVCRSHHAMGPGPVQEEQPCSGRSARHARDVEQAAEQR